MKGLGVRQGKASPANLVSFLGPWIDQLIIVLSGGSGSRSGTSKF